MMIRNLIIIVLFLILSATTFAYQETPYLYRGLRPLGMGNAFIGVSDDHNALSYNPAGLNDVEGVRVEILNPTVEISMNVIDIIKTVLDVRSDLSDTDSGATASEIFDTVIDKHLGEYTSIRAALAPSLTMKNFSMRFLAEPRGYFAFRDAIVPHLEYSGRMNGSLVIGGAYGFMDKALQVGLSVKPVYSWATGEREIGVHNYEEFSDELKDFGDDYGFYTDLGFKSHLEVIANNYEIPYVTPAFNYLRPRVGLTLQDIPLYSFDAVDGLPFSISMGGAGSFDFWKFKNTFALDVRDMNRSGNPITKLYLGAESIWDLSKLFRPGARIGLSQGRPTLGLSCDLLRIWRGEIAFYYEEIGTYDRIKGDLRFALQLTLLGWY